MFTNPTMPNLPDYMAFLYGTVGIPKANLPSATGTATGGSATTLVDSTQSWLVGQWAGSAVLDTTQNAFAWVASNTATTLNFASPLTNPVAANDAYLLMNGFIAITLKVAQEIVNDVLNLASPLLYTLAVYNLAADRLINFAVDQTNQTYFDDQRKNLNIMMPSVGVVSGSSDESTSTSLLNPEAMKTFTLQDLQTLKTFYGRTYMSYAQMYGPDIWGIS